jgi:hypothetical protein
MSDNPEKYLYFSVGFLKHSFALEALWQDALQHHLVDHPGLLIALRLTEYYELRSRGLIHSATTMSPPVTPPLSSDAGHNGEEVTREAVENLETRPLISLESDDDLQDQPTAIASLEAEQNAEEAANYWTLL